MKTAMFLSIALALSGAAFAAPGDGAREAPQSVYTYELELDGNGMISNLSPHGFTPDATSAALEHDIRTWLFHSGGNVAEGTTTLTYLRVVVQPEATESDGFEVVSATTGPRSEEHTSELQSLMRISYAVFCLKKKKKNNSKH